MKPLVRVLVFVLAAAGSAADALPPPPAWPADFARAVAAGDWTEARRLLEPRLRAEGSDLEDFVRLGMVLAREPGPEEGARHLAAMERRPGMAAHANLALASLYVNAGRPQDADAPARTAMKAYIRRGDRLGEALCLEHIAVWAEATGRLPEGLRAMERVRTLHEEMGSPPDKRANILNSLGLMLANTGEYARAAALLDESLALHRFLGPSTAMARALLNRGIVHVYMGGYGEGIALFRQSAAMHEASGSAGEAAYALNNEGAACWVQGRYAEALEAMGRARAMWERLGHMRGLSYTLDGMALVYADAGRTEEAMRLVQESMNLRRRAGDRRGAAQSLDHLGRLLSLAGRHDEALRHRLRAFEEAEAAGDMQAAANALANAGDALLQAGRAAEAIPYFEKALERQRAFGNPYFTVLPLLGLAEASRRTGGLQDAHARASEAVAQARAAASPHMLAMACGTAALIAAESNLPGEAMQGFRCSLEALEQMRASFGGEEMSSGFLADRISVYESFAGFLAGQGLEAESFAVAEKMKARGFLDELGAARMNAAGLPRELALKRMALEARLKWLSSQTP